VYPPASSSVQERAAIESDVAEPYILPELRTIRDSTEGAEPQRSPTSTAPAAPNHTPDSNIHRYRLGSVHEIDLDGVAVGGEGERPRDQFAVDFRLA
jgi:hypothetical protein